MCKPNSYAGKNCATCAEASAKATEAPCGECIEIELTTKVPFTKWRAKQV